MFRRPWRSHSCNIPVVLVVQVPRACVVKKTPLVQVMAKTTQISQLPLIDKISVIPEIRTVPDTETSESLNTAFLRRVTQAEIGASSVPEHGWSAGMQRSTQRRDSSQAVASNNCKQTAQERKGKTKKRTSREREVSRRKRKGRKRKEGGRDWGERKGSSGRNRQ